MVKFSAILSIVLSEFFFVANYAKEISDIIHSSSVEVTEAPGINRSERSPTDNFSLIGSKVKYENLTNLESKRPNLSHKFEDGANFTRSLINGRNNYYELNIKREEKEASRIEDRDRSTNVGNNSAEIRDILEPGNYSPANDGKDPFDDSQHQGSIEFASIPEDSFAETKETNPGDSPKILTLMNFTEPVILRDAECLEDEGLTNSEHVRVKRGFQNSDKSLKNEFVRKKRIDYEMMFPRSDLRSAPEVPDDRESSKEINGDDSVVRTNSDPEYIGSPVFLESFSEYEKPEASDSGRDNSDFLNSGKNPTNYKSEVFDSGGNEIGNRYSKRRRRKRFVGRVKRRGGARGKKAKTKHPKKHKKKRKKVKEPGGKGEEHADSKFVSNSESGEYGTSNKREMSHFVDELQVEAHIEKRDSGDARSEIDIGKREVSGNYSGNIEREKRALQNEGNSATREKSPLIAKSADLHRPECRNGELRYYDDVWEPDLQTQRVFVETRPESVEGLPQTRKERTANSVRQIKKLIDELIDEVDDLDTVVNSAENEESKAEKKRVSDFSNSTKSGEGRDSRNATKDRRGSRLCSEETNSPGSKLDSSITGSWEDKGREKTEEKRSRRTLRRGRDSKKLKIRKRKSHRKWDKWTDWSSCSVTCGKGRQIRWRHCIHDCSNAETEMEEKSCQLPACGPGKFLGIF